MKVSFSSIWIRIFCLFVVVVPIHAVWSREAESIDEPVSLAAVDRAILLATHYMVDACGAEGKFVYEVDVATGKSLPDYNVVRHGGAMSVLAMAYDFRPDPRVADALIRSAGFLRRAYVRAGPDFHGKETLAISASPADGPRSGTATLGATGLGLFGLVGLERIKGGSVPETDLEALGRFLLFLQKKDGAFNSKYLADGNGGRFTAWGSLYYPGEAALALVSFGELDQSEKWQSASEKALVHLAKIRRNMKDVPADNWALIATAKLLEVRGASMPPKLRALLVRHAVQVCEGILAEQLENMPQSALDGGFHRDGRTTPTSTRLEGLLASLEFLPTSEQGLRARIKTAVQRGVRFLLPAQISTGPYAGGIPEAVPGLEDSVPAHVRIDYVQHFLSAMIRYRRLLALETGG